MTLRSDRNHFEIGLEVIHHSDRGIVNMYIFQPFTGPRSGLVTTSGLVYKFTTPVCYLFLVGDS